MAEPTAAIRSIEAKVNARFGTTGNKGIYSCRNIKGTSTPSQHAWANAIDLDVYGYTAQAPYVAFLETLPEAMEILWSSNRPSDHTDHIHVTGVPKMTGTPPCMGGEVTYNPDEVTALGIGDTIEDIFQFGSPQDIASGKTLGQVLNWAGLNLGQIALQFLYGVVGVSLIIVGGVIIVNDATGGRTAKVVKDIAPLPGPVKQVLPGG